METPLSSQGLRVTAQHKRETSETPAEPSVLKAPSCDSVGALGHKALEPADASQCRLKGALFAALSGQWFRQKAASHSLVISAPAQHRSRVMKSSLTCSGAGRRQNLSRAPRIDLPGMGNEGVSWTRLVPQLGRF